MASLLNGVNAVLKRTGVIKGNSGELSSLTDPQRQVVVDLTVQAWNEAIVDLFDSASIPFPKEAATNTITLATGDRDYALQSDLVQLRWPLKNLTNGLEIHPYPGGWEQLIADQTIPANYQGKPSYGVIEPISGELYLDMVPTSQDNGDQYTYWYDKELLVSAAADTFPFTDTVYTSMIPVVAELVKRDRENSFDTTIYRRRMATAVGQLTQAQPRTSWAPVRISSVNTSDPLEA